MLPVMKMKRPSHGANASNSMWRIEIDPKLESFHAVLAQELFEFGWKWKWGRGFATPFSKSLQRKMEVRGHEVEVQWKAMWDSLDDDQVVEYRWAEARALSRYKAFKGLSVDTIYDMMLEVIPEANKWVVNNHSYVMKHDKR